MPTAEGGKGADQSVAVTTDIIADLHAHLDGIQLRDINAGLRFLDIYSTRVICRLFSQLGLFASPGEERSVDQAIEESGLNAQAAKVPLAFMCMWLAARGFLKKSERDGILHYLPTAPLPNPDLDELDRHPIAVKCAAACSLIRRIVNVCDPIFRGHGRELQLYAPETIPDWEGYFGHPAMKAPAVLNALYLYQQLQGFKRPVRIMELGAGSALGTRVLYDLLAAKGELDRVEAFHVTDVAEPFIEVSRKVIYEAYADRSKFIFYKMDMNGRSQDQGLEPASVDIIFGMNCLQYMTDWRTQFPMLRELLRPGGILSVVGVMRKRLELPIHIELAGAPFAEYWDVATIPELRPGFGIMPPQLLEAGLKRFAFDATEIWPPPATWEKEYPMDFFYGVVVGKRL
jgi:SAM-dependent methyltransferase